MQKRCNTEFDKDFIWGVSSSAMQTEGGVYADGKGECVWDSKFTQGKIFANQNADRACEHYFHYKEDVTLMKKLGIKSYRFSVSWPRIFPNGTGEINQNGLDFYISLLDELRGAGIRPFVTLYHWEMPRTVYERGGFLNPEISDWFTVYAETVVKAFGERVSDYVIINEMQCIVEEQYATANHAPFLALSRSECFNVAHNVLLCIGKAEKAMRKAVKHKLNIGVAPCFTPLMPTDTVDEKRAEEENFSPTGDFWDGCFFTDMLLRGECNEKYKEWFIQNVYNPTKKDLSIIKSKLDFFGINIYRGFYLEKVDGRIRRVKPKPNDKLTAMNWEVTPECIYYAVKYYYERYHLPIIITENGIALTEWATKNGETYDYERMDYIKTHLEYLKKASEKYNIKGYFYWCFMDNFEWSLGYAKHFGLVNVDFETMERKAKRSAYYYKKVIETNGKDLSYDEF